jgi:hypothetical protein
VLVGASLLGLTLGVAAPVLAATSITLVSGAGSGGFGTADPNVTYAIPATGATAAAVLVEPNEAYAAISGARWINTTGSTGGDQASGHTTSYSIPFDLPDGFSAPSITVEVLADNAGTVVLNGVQIGQQPQADITGNFRTIATFTNSDPAAFQTGPNSLTVSDADFGISNGVDFKAVVTFTEDSTGPTASPTRTPEPNANGWSNTDVTVDWNWTDAGTGIDPAACTTSSTTTGEFGADGQTLTANCANLAGTIGSAELTITNVDKTLPTITATATTPANGAGWYDGPVTIHFTCGDELSGIPADACPADQVLDAEGASTSTARTVTDAAGNTSQPSNTVTADIDATAPTIVATVATQPAPGADGWYTDDVAVQFACSDSGSGIPDGACPADEVLATEGTAVASTARTVTDAANNASDESNVVTVKIDKTGPVLKPSIGPGPILLNGAADADAGAADVVSGIVSQACEAVDTSAVGRRTVHCTATNGAGLTTSVDVAYLVTYRFDGFLQPVNDTGHSLTCGSPCPASTFKGGSTVPVKFDLKDANGLAVEAASAPLWVVPQMGGPTDAAVDENVLSDPAATDATYRQNGSHYSHLWSTKGYATGFFWRIGVTLDDGQTYYVSIALR